MVDKRSETSADNGKLGGRPISPATLIAQASRLYIAEQVEKSLSPIVARAINDAVLGDHQARQWLSDNGWGKAPINLGFDAGGKPLLISNDE